MSVVYMKVVNGVIKGWKISVEKMTRGGRMGYAGGNEI
jgi:FKBP-type peptidyl-prolyl cis-trans isomerase